jgi:dephospho-CoA kinase
MNRINSQLSQGEKNKLSDFVIDNNGSLDDLKRSVDFLLPIVKTLPNKEHEHE